MAELRTAAAKPKTEPRHIHTIRIEIGKDGGHVVHHEYRGGDPEYFGGGEEGPHIFGAEDGEKLLDHIKKHAGIKESTDEEGKEDEKEKPEKANKRHEEREEAKDEEAVADE
jgi:hypothetical protein